MLLRQDLQSERESPGITDSRAHWGAIAEWCGVNDICMRSAYDDYGRPKRQWAGIAKGSNPNQWPIMQLWVNGIKRQKWTVNRSSWTDYTATVPLTGRDQIDIVFPNDNGSGGIDANLYIDWIQVNGVTHQESSAIVDIDAGADAFDGDNVRPGTNLY